MANKNTIKVARSITRDNLPAAMDYGMLGYVKNDRFIVGNGDGTDFVINDWNNLKNKPDIAGLERTLAFTADEPIQRNRAVRVKPTNGRVVRASKTSRTNARVIGICVQDTDVTGGAVLIQIEGTVEDPSWTWTPGDAIYLSNTVGDLTNDITGFADSDLRTFIGVAISATEIALNIQQPQTLDEAQDLVQAITDGDTTGVPSADAVHDYVQAQFGILNADIISNSDRIDTIYAIDDSGTETGLVADLRTDVDALDVRLTDAENDITSNATEISNNATDIQTITDFVNNLTTASVTDGDTSHVPTADAVHDYVQTEVSNVTITPVQSITNGDTTGVPSADAVFDHVASEIANVTFTPASAVTDGDTTNAPSGDAVHTFVTDNTVPYSGNTREAGKFYSGTTDPVSTNRLNFDGNLHVNDLHTNAASIYIGETRISTETGALIYKPDSQIDQDYEVVLTQLTGTLGPNPQTRMKGETFIDESLLVLNQKQVGGNTPSRNARFEVERGAENNTAIRWNETSDRWEMTNDGSTFYPVVLLDANGKISADNLPASIVNALKYKGTWPASGGTWPSNPEPGHYYIISAAGTIDATELQPGDWIVYNDTYWDKIDNTERVASVAGKIGNVTLDSSDVGLENVANAQQVRAPATSTTERLVRWQSNDGTAVNTAPVSVDDTANLTLHGHQSKITIDRQGAGASQEFGWDEVNNRFYATAPITTPETPGVFKNSTALSADTDNFLRIEGAQLAQFDIVISDMFAQNVHAVHIDAVVGWNTIKWTQKTIGRKIGNAHSKCKPYMVLDGMNLQLGFEVKSGQWLITVKPTAIPFASVSTVTYISGTN